MADRVSNRDGERACELSRMHFKFANQWRPYKFLGFGILGNMDAYEFHSNVARTLQMVCLNNANYNQKEYVKYNEDVLLCMRFQAFSAAPHLLPAKNQ